jgi:hypothetical protein
MPPVKEETKEDPWAKLGSGAKLNSKTNTPAPSSNAQQSSASRSQAIVIDDDDDDNDFGMYDSGSDFDGFEDNDVIDIDSD